MLWDLLGFEYIRSLGFFKNKFSFRVFLINHGAFVLNIGLI